MARRASFSDYLMEIQICSGLRFDTARTAMVHKRKIIVFIATSGRRLYWLADNSIDWLDRPRPKGNYGMGAFYKSIDTVLWGRKIYDMALDYQKKASPGRPSIPELRTMSSHAGSRNHQRPRAWSS